MGAVMTASRVLNMNGQQIAQGITKDVLAQPSGQQMYEKLLQQLQSTPMETPAPAAAAAPTSAGSPATIGPGIDDIDRR